MKEVQEVLNLRDASMDDLFTVSQEIQSLCSDYSVSSEKLSKAFFDGNHYRLSYVTDENEVRKAAMTRYSLGQMCAKLGIPVRYIDKCISEGWLSLADENINSWLQEYPKNLFIREYDGIIRGVLSDRFAVLDTPDILDVLSTVVPLNEYKVKGYLVSSEKFHVRLIHKNPLDIEGEDLFTGLQVDSSDVGRSVLTVKFLIWKQVCTNGLCISKGGGTLFSQKHIGIDKTDFIETFTDSIQCIPDLTVQAKELIMSAKRNADYSVKGFTEKQMDEFIDRIKFKTKLPDDGVSKVLRLMEEEYGHSTWGFVNSLTEVAQDYTLDRRIEIEKIAGEYLLAA